MKINISIEADLVRNRNNPIFSLALMCSHLTFKKYILDDVKPLISDKNPPYFTTTGKGKKLS